MSLIAGLSQSSPERESTARVRERLSGFVMLPSLASSAGQAVNSVFATRSGWLALKHSPLHPLPPLAHRDAEGNTLVLLGYVLEEAAAGGVRRRESAQRLHELCTTESPEALTEREGEFVCLFADAASGTLHVVNDRFGARPFYLLRTPGRTHVSSNLACLCRLAEHRPAPDPIGWMQVASFAHTLGARTTFAEVERLRPATCARIAGDQVETRRYWRFQHQPVDGRDPRAWAAAVAASLRAAVRDRAALVGRGIVALSGGLDSRIIAASLPADAAFTFLTFVNSTAPSPTLEVKCATQVAARLGLRQDIVPIADSALSGAAEDLVSLTGGLVPMHHQAGTLRFIAAMRSGPRFLLGSGPGDTLAGAFPASSGTLDPQRADEMIGRFLRHRNSAPEPGDLALLFRRDLVETHFTALAGEARATFDEVGGPTPAHRITAWAMVFRQPAFTMTSPIHTHPEVAEAVPFLDYAYADHMLTLPADWLYARRFYAYMIYQAAPALRDVVVANSGRPLDGAWPGRAAAGGRRNAVRALLERILPRTLDDRLRRERMRRRPSFHHALLAGDERLLKTVDELVHDLPAAGALIDPERCARFLSGFRAGRVETLSRKTDAELVGTLATMCYTFRMLGI